MTNSEIIRGVYAAFAKGDVPAVLAAFDSKIDWREAERYPYPGPFVGPNDVLQGVFARLGAEWEAYRSEVAEVLESGDAVVVLGTESGTFRATGKSFRSACVHVWRLRGGKAVSFRQHVDTALVLEAMKK